MYSTIKSASTDAAAATGELDFAVITTIISSQVQYYGKWPFVRVLGAQEIVSALASIGNGLPYAFYAFFENPLPTVLTCQIYAAVILTCCTGLCIQRLRESARSCWNEYLVLVNCVSYPRCSGLLIMCVSQRSQQSS